MNATVIHNNTVEYVIATAVAATTATVDAVVAAAKIRRIFSVLSLCECIEKENY